MCTPRPIRGPIRLARRVHGARRGFLVGVMLRTGIEGARSSARARGKASSSATTTRRKRRRGRGRREEKDDEDEDEDEDSLRGKAEGTPAGRDTGARYGWDIDSSKASSSSQTPVPVPPPAQPAMGDSERSGEKSDFDLVESFSARASQGETERQRDRLLWPAQAQTHGQDAWTGQPDIVAGRCAGAAHKLRVISGLAGWRAGGLADDGVVVEDEVEDEDEDADEDEDEEGLMRQESPAAVISLSCPFLDPTDRDRPTLAGSRNHGWLREHRQIDMDSEHGQRSGVASKRELVVLSSGPEDTASLRLR
ncbi:hypothetical protein K490DRAFT_55696 [Saccharata proteae CBS 121410]|uniref:Uncharacterized protein n=1 Tax=Saccharata proteae CBS 121410 TaxID=1314787 RepID=A0A6A5YB64_9PEZI|nr:hypothetical protein K490DRAFT_55696 [Saccharata proteae CBS 121410]